MTAHAHDPATRARHDIEGLARRLPDTIRLETNPAIVKQKSRDFFWYSPVLKRQLDGVTGDAVAFARSREDVVEILRACFALGIPVTPRGTGTGNYGQAMPLSGGVVLDLSGLSGVTEARPGRFKAGAGTIISKIDAETRPLDGRFGRAGGGQEVRLHPSTYSTATIGGFVAGGSGGVGSIAWGGLRDAGNIISLEVVTMEAEPRVLTLSGEDLAKVAHAYGTNGVITAVEMPLGPAHEWVDLIVGFDALEDAAAYANMIGEQDGIAKKQLAVIQAPVAHDYFKRHARLIPRGKTIVAAMIADFAMDAVETVTRRVAGAEILYRSDLASEEDRRTLPPAFELGWNHTTLRALRVDPAISYLQVLYPFPNQLDTISRIHARFGDEVPAHLEFVRFDGKVTAFGLPLVRVTSEERLEEIMRLHEDMGAPIFNPHRYTLEEGGMKQTDAVQLAFKREADPRGLLNPGKMIAWDDPDYDYSAPGTYLFKGLASEAA